MPAADWQPDPSGRHQSRRRNPDGTWSDQVADYGVMSRDAYDGVQPQPVPPPESEPKPDRTAEAAPVQNEPTPTGKKPFWTPTKVAILIILVVIGLFIAACGPETMCLAQGGDPAQNAFGMEWCELDGNNIPSEGDFSLNW